MTEKLPVFKSLGCGRVLRPAFIPPPGRRGAGLVIEDTRALREPAWIGTSCGAEPRGAAGTIGCRVIDADGTAYVLSCWHVLVRGKSLRVRHPGSQDSVEHVSLGPVVASVRPAFGGIPNVTDAAICRLEEPHSVCCAVPPHSYGMPATEPIAPTLGMTALKYGRTTRETVGIVEAVNAVVTVAYSAGSAIFRDVCVVRIPGGIFCKPGDSGALVVAAGTHRPIGLLFGWSRGGEYGLIAPIGATLQALEALGVPELRVDGLL